MLYAGADVMTRKSSLSQLMGGHQTQQGVPIERRNVCLSIPITARESRANNRSSIAPDNPARISADHRLGYGCLVLGIAYGHRALSLYFLWKSILQRAI